LIKKPSIPGLSASVWRKCAMMDEFLNLIIRSTIGHSYSLFIGGVPASGKPQENLYGVII
jgi:hypothetical protein